MACGRDSRTVLLVYSPHGKDLLQDVQRGFEREYPQVNLQWDDMGSAEVLDRIRAEAANPQADVWFGAPADLFAKAASEGLLQPYAPTWAADVPAEARDSADRWFGTYLTPEVIAYNSEAVPDSAAPKDWDDVLDPKWKGRVIIRDPIASGTMREIFGAILERSIAATGSTAAGWNWLRRLDANTREYTLNPTILYQKIARREGLITLYDMPDIALLQQRQHLPIKYVIPTSGTPLLVDAIAIVKGTRHPHEAQLFYEYVTSREALLHPSPAHLPLLARLYLPEEPPPSHVPTPPQHNRPMPLARTYTPDSLAQLTHASTRRARRFRLIVFHPALYNSH